MAIIDNPNKHRHPYYDCTGAALMRRHVTPQYPAAMDEAIKKSKEITGSQAVYGPQDAIQFTLTVTDHFSHTAESIIQSSKRVQAAYHKFKVDARVAAIQETSCMTPGGTIYGIPWTGKIICHHDDVYRAIFMAGVDDVSIDAAGVYAKNRLHKFIDKLK